VLPRPDLSLWRRNMMIKRFLAVLIVVCAAGMGWAAVTFNSPPPAAYGT